MKYIYLRHGLTSYSVKNKFMGRANLPLLSQDSEKFTGSIELINDHSIDTVLCSPLLRAKQTFDIISPHINLNKYIESDFLIERDFGLFEGMEKTEKNRLLLDENKSVESLDLFRSRISSFSRSMRMEIIIFLLLAIQHSIEKQLSCLSLKIKTISIVVRQ